MTGLVLKLIACPLIVLATDYFLPNVTYSTFYQPVIVGLIIAVAGHLAEALLLKRGTLWITTAVDFALATLIVYYSQLLFPRAYVTWTGAGTTAFLIAAVESLTHLYLIRTGKAKKQP